jgi:Ca-activated chloride channel family protein
MNDFQFPLALWFLIPLGLVLFFRLRNIFLREEGYPRQEWKVDHLTIQLSTKDRLFATLRELFPFSRFIAAFCLILAAAGPGVKRTFLPSEKYGIDIMIALDISGSMVKSRDFLPRNRLEVSKDLLEEFIGKRWSDRIGLVVFAGAAYLQSPLTNDMQALKEIVSEMETDTIEEQGTAIGDAILLSTYRLKSSKTKTKILILLTDGVSNTGKIDPETATETARAFQVRIYTIGIGREEGEYEVNFSSLAEIAQRTGGNFYRAESPQELDSVLQEIDRLEKDVLVDKPKEFIQTQSFSFLVLGIVFLLLDWGGRSFVFRFFP